MRIHPTRRLTVVLPLAVIALLILALTVAGGAFAESGDMSGMEGMEGMTSPAPTATPADAHAAAPADGHGSEAGMDPNMEMGGGSANWFVVGGFVLLIVAVTLAAVATKRHLRRRMLAGELAGAGVQSV